MEQIAKFRLDGEADKRAYKRKTFCVCDGCKKDLEEKGGKYVGWSTAARNCEVCLQKRQKGLVDITGWRPAWRKYCMKVSLCDVCKHHYRLVHCKCNGTCDVSRCSHCGKLWHGKWIGYAQKLTKTELLEKFKTYWDEDDEAVDRVPVEVEYGCTGTGTRCR